MKHDWRLILAVKEQLVDDVQKNRDQNQGDTIA
jgi:hypothetical protein